MTLYVVVARNDLIKHILIPKKYGWTTLCGLKNPVWAWYSKSATGVCQACQTEHILRMMAL